MEEHKPQKFMFFHGLAGGGGVVWKKFMQIWHATGLACCKHRGFFPETMCRAVRGI